MPEIVVQTGIAVFGLSALWMAMGDNTVLRKWAPIVGLIGQVFWLTNAWQSKSVGVGILAVAYTVVYAHGAWSQFLRKGTR